MKTYSACLTLILSFLLLSHASASDTGDELNRLYLDVVEDAVDVFEPLWVDDSQRVPNSGFFDFRKYPNWRDEPYATIIVVPGNGMVAFCYGVLLTETDKQTFTAKQVPRERLLEHAVQSIRWCCLTSTYVENPYDYLPNTRPEFLVGKNWRRVFSYRADEVGWLTMAAAVLWDELDDETRGLVESVMIGGAPKERIVQTWKPNQAGNHDQVKQDLSSTVGAAYLFPKRDDRNLYLDIIRGNAIDMVSTIHDFGNPVKADGKPIREWAQGWNLYPDYSSDHHGWCNLWYGGDMIFEGRMYVEILSAMTGKPVPETFTYPGNGCDGVLEWLKVLSLPSGESASIHGNEYDAYYGLALLAYAYGAVLNDDPVAASLEWQAAQLLKRHSKAIRQYDYHRNSWAKAATVYLLRKYRGAGVKPLSTDEAWRRLEGTRHYRWQRNLIHRSPGRWASFSWGTIASTGLSSLRRGSGLCGFAVPSGSSGFGELPFIYCHPKSLIGDFEVEPLDKNVKRITPEANYLCTRTDQGFHTAGIVADNCLRSFYAFFSVGDASCVLFTRVTAERELSLGWTGLPVYFFVRDGVTPSRRLVTARGERLLGEAADLKSSWWCVDDRLGLVNQGGSGELRVQRSIGNNWARLESYRDQCDGVFFSPIEKRRFKAGEKAADFSTLIYPNTTSKQLAKVQAGMNKSSLELPPGWVGTYTPDTGDSQERLLAVANFDSTNRSAAITLTSDKGAPIFSIPAIVRGKESQFMITLDPLETFGEIPPFTIETKGKKAVQVDKISASQYRITPLADGKTKLILRDEASGKKFMVREENGKRIKERVFNRDATKKGVAMAIGQPILLEIETPDAPDRVGPAVEIANVTVREDGRASVEVMANDTSGISSVELFAGEKSLGVKTRPPYRWNHRPAKGYRTYYAVATDRFDNTNTSFKHTVNVDRP